MIVQEVLDEIIERLPDNTISVPSILRKVTQVRDNLIRNYTAAQQQSEAVSSEMDMIANQAMYPIPCPASSVIEVEIRTSSDDSNPRWARLDYRSFDARYIRPYYYMMSGTIGLYPTPTMDILRGIKVFHQPVIPGLTVNDLNGPTGFDPNFDMVLVYGVLKDVTSGSTASEHGEKYQQWLKDYEAANSGYGHYVIDERW